MRRTRITLLFLAVIGWHSLLKAQTCTDIGQNPGSAFPVCGTKSFAQQVVKNCGGASVPGPCTQDLVSDINPFWYKFTCFEAGKLGLLLTPNTLSDDYDWQLFDITGRNAQEVYTNKDLFVACNWSGESGKTGASANGKSSSICGGYGKELFSSMPDLVKDHEYILLISHFTANSQSGYSLEFSGTANITDPKPPELLSASSNCEGSSITVALNKKMKCISLAADGSDFSISPSSAVITGANSASCNSSFDMDSVIITLSSPLPVGPYTVAVKNGSDGNSLFDNCANNIPVGNQVSLQIFPVQPTPMDSLTKPACAPASLKLVFRKPIRCSSIASDGSDFIISGPGTATIVSAGGNCAADNATTIEIKLQQPLTVKGTYQVTLRTGNDGNTLIDECGQETPPASLSFYILPPADASFSRTISLGCRFDTVMVAHNGLDDVNKWTWSFDGTDIRSTSQAMKVYSTTGDKKISLIVSNGFCSDTAMVNINLPDKIKSVFESPAVICAVDPALFNDKSTGDIVQWKWDFGNQTSSSQPSPKGIYYPRMNGEKKYKVSLSVTGNNGCKDTSSRLVTVVGNCYITVPSAFTPNNDGINDYLYPSNAYKAENLTFRIYNRFGQVVFQTNDWTHKWNGEFNGHPQSSGGYIWTLTYTNTDTKQKVFLKGSTMLLR
ncbi:MAG: gliding motility-associated C-terminal domain-containing protein [Flavitalea sp.]